MEGERLCGRDVWPPGTAAVQAADAWGRSGDGAEVQARLRAGVWFLHAAFVQGAVNDEQDYSTGLSVYHKIYLAIS
jgi:hypothetical protein